MALAKFFARIVIASLVLAPASVFAVTIDASKVMPTATVYFSPRTGSFVEGSTFEVPVLLNTRGSSVNAVEIKVRYDSDALSIIQSSSGKSIIGVWVDPPSYDNSRGSASFVGVIPDGIVTDAGLVASITFKAKRTGTATLGIQQTSRVLLNDGLGSEMVLDAGRASYSILTKAPEGVVVYSETHPSQSSWYNNNSPVLSWDKDAGVSGFSYVLDDKPSTVPPNQMLTTDTAKAYEGLKDGLWYFHIKANKNGVWGTTGHYLVRIDTNPPAKFTPEVSYVVAAAIVVERALVSFFTTDNLSGIDHYEVGVIDKSQPVTESPVFVEAESPFQVPNGGNLRVIVRAVDKAGNVRDESINVGSPFALSAFIDSYLVWILLFIILIALAYFAFHYLFGHKLIPHLKRAWMIMRREEEQEKRMPQSTTQMPVEKIAVTPSPQPVEQPKQQPPEPPAPPLMTG